MSRFELGPSSIPSSTGDRHFGLLSVITEPGRAKVQSRQSPNPREASVDLVQIWSALALPIRSALLLWSLAMILFSPPDALMHLLPWAMPKAWTFRSAASTTSNRRAAGQRRDLCGDAARSVLNTSALAVLSLLLHVGWYRRFDLARVSLFEDSPNGC